MAGFDYVSTLAHALTGGKSVTNSFRKVPSQASTAGWWVDLSMASGSPPPQFYAAEPYVAAILSPLKGLYHGPSVLPDYKFLTRLGLCTQNAALVGQYMLLDYLVYYAFIDLDSTASQPLDNTVVLPRYATGEGVQAMLVCVAPTTGGGSFTFNYNDQNGNPKVSPVQSCGTSVANISNLVTGQQATVAGVGPFLQLASGSTGIRAITQVDMIVPNGGLGALVLVKPLVDSVIREINTPREVGYGSQSALKVRIYDNAYLGMIMNCAASVAASTVIGWADFAWS